MNASQDLATPRWSSLLAWLKRCNQTLLGWAASLSWTRLFILIVVVSITGSLINDRLDLRHGHERVKVKIDDNTGERQPDAADADPADGAEDDCSDTKITIGGKKFIVICDGKKSLFSSSAASAPAAAPPTSAASASAGAATPIDAATTSRDAPDKPVVKIKINKTKEQSVQSSVQESVQRTFGGFLGDLFWSLMIALFAYLIAAKIIVRKSAESDALVREAKSNAEHEALERQLVQARLQLLQAQVEPHFLFNTLAAVDYLIETDPPRASLMQKQLITYLRGALPQMREDSSTLGREVSLIRAYLELLKMRIEDRLEFVIDVPSQLNRATFPPMVLQSIIENAIKHGIEPKPEGGKISVMAQARDGNLWVDVVDNGVGLPEGNVFGVSASSTGLGLDNIRKRLALLYPNASRIELRSEIPCGTSVRIMIPYQTEASAKAAS